MANPEHGGPHKEEKHDNKHNGHEKKGGGGLLSPIKNASDLPREMIGNTVGKALETVSFENLVNAAVSVGQEFAAKPAVDAVTGLGDLLQETVTGEAPGEAKPSGGDGGHH